MSISTFDAARAAVQPIDTDGAGAAAVRRSDQLTKPQGSLGRVEELGTQLAAIARSCPPPVPQPVSVCVFAGDHGVIAEGVTSWPQEVTAQMVANFCAGGAAINVLAHHAGAQVQVVDVGVATDIPLDSPMLLRRRIRPGTANLATGPAMSRTDALAAFDVGAEVAADAVASGARMLVTGDMGIGNTTPSAALIAAITKLPASEVTGRGTGIDDAMLELKTAIVQRATERVPAGASPIDLLAEVGGLEIAALTGFIVGGAAAGVPVLLDGVIAASAALVAVEMSPDVTGYLIAGHQSAEPGSAAALRHLGVHPVLDLNLRLGEGSGAALAIPIVQAAAKILREMSSFEDAQVSPGH